MTDVDVTSTATSVDVTGSSTSIDITGGGATGSSAAIEYLTIDLLLASTETTRGEGQYWWADGFRFKEASASATDQDFTTAGGIKLYVVRVQGSGVWDVRAFNAKGDGSTDDLTAFRACFAKGATSGFNCYRIPPANLGQKYKLSDSVPVDCSNLWVDAEGALINFYGAGTSGSPKFVFDWGSTGLADESVTTSAQFWRGGEIENENAWNADHNYAFRIRGLSGGRLSNVSIKGFRTGISYSGREHFTIDQLKADDNGRHVHIPQFQTTGSNPRSLAIDNPQFGTHHEYALDVEGSANGISIKGGFITGENAVRVRSAALGSLSLGKQVAINNVSFRAGSSTAPYISVDDGTSELRGFLISGCLFEASDDGVSTQALIANVKRVNGFHFSENIILDGKVGWLTFDANCKNVNLNIGSCDMGGNPRAITFPESTRKQIQVLPNNLPVNPESNEGIIDTGFFNGGTETTATVDVTTETFSEPINSLIKIVPPRQVVIQLDVYDTQSSTASTNTNYYSIIPKDTTANRRYFANCDLSGRPNSLAKQVTTNVELGVEYKLTRLSRSSASGNMIAISRFTAIQW